MSFLSSELVLWNHISGYITFSLFSIYGILFLAKYLNTNKIIFGIISLVLCTLSEFTYELGVVINGIIAAILIINYGRKPKLSIENRNHLFLSKLFIGSALLYPLLSIFDLTLRDLQFGSIDGNSVFTLKILEATWYALLQILFWIGGLLFPMAYEIHAGERSVFSYFNLTSQNAVLNFSLIVSAWLTDKSCTPSPPTPLPGARGADPPLRFPLPWGEG